MSTVRRRHFFRRIVSGEAVSAEPFLYVTTLFAAIYVSLTGDSPNQRFWPDIGLPDFIGHAWSWLMIASPLQAMCACIFLTFGTGSWRVWGMWQRLAGNAGLCLGMMAFVIARLRLYALDPPQPASFGIIMIAGIAVYSAVLVARDVSALVLLERTTVRIEQQRRGDNVER